MTRIILELDIADDEENALFLGDKLYSEDGTYAATILSVVKEDK